MTLEEEIQHYQTELQKAQANHEKMVEITQQARDAGLRIDGVLKHLLQKQAEEEEARKEANAVKAKKARETRAKTEKGRRVEQPEQVE